MVTKTLDAHIVMAKGFAGGKPHVAGRGITVQNIAIWHERLGKSVDEISVEHELSLAEIYAALSYYFDHRFEIDRQIEADNAFVATLRSQMRSPLQAKLTTVNHG